MGSLFGKKIDEENIGNVRIACYLVLIMLTVVTGFVTMGRDMQSLLRFYLAFMALGVLAMPAVKVIFRGLDTDGSYLFGRVAGLALSAYLMWILSSVHVLPFGHLCSRSW